MHKNSMYNKKVRIVIIDSGIDDYKSDLSKYIEKSIGFTINEDGKINEILNKNISHEHGTAIALIIRNICKNVQFISINILNQILCTNGNVLICALEKALSYNPDIVHLSLGTKKLRYYFRLKNIIRKAKKNNIIVVAAVSNNGRRCYPAYMKGVIAVKSLYVKDFNSLYYKDGFFYAYPRLTGIKGIEELDNKNLCGNSFAAAYITGYIACEIYNESNNK